MTSQHPAGQAPAAIDLSARPSTYFWPIDPQKHLVGRVKGTVRRTLVQGALGGDGLEGLPAALSAPSLATPTRASFGRLGRAMMGGEYLADASDAELEIARIEIKSTTYDVTSLYARAGKTRIHYRVVDEYEGETLESMRRRSSMKPLTLGAMTTFFLGAWNLMRVLEINYEDDLPEMLEFFKGSSSFYPDFDRLLRRLVTTRFGHQDEVHAPNSVE